MLLTGAAFLQTLDSPDRDLFDDSWIRKEENASFLCQSNNLCLDIKEKNKQPNKKRRDSILMVYYFLRHLFQESK